MLVKRLNRKRELKAFLKLFSNYAKQKNDTLKNKQKSFACLDDNQECDKQCSRCKFVEDNLKTE